MSKSKEKFLAALQEIEEYKDIAISRLDIFYSVIAEHFPRFDAKIDDEAKKRFPRVCALAKNKQKLVVLGKSLHCNNCYVFVEEILLEFLNEVMKNVYGSILYSPMQRQQNLLSTLKA